MQCQTHGLRLEVHTCWVPLLKGEMPPRCPLEGLSSSPGIGSAWEPGMVGCSCSPLVGLETEVKSSSLVLIDALPISGSGDVLAVAGAAPSSFSSRYLIQALSLADVAA